MSSYADRISAQFSVPSPSTYESIRSHPNHSISSDLNPSPGPVHQIREVHNQSQSSSPSLPQTMPSVLSPFARLPPKAGFLNGQSFTSTQPTVSHISSSMLRSNSQLDSHLGSRSDLPRSNGEENENGNGQTWVPPSIISPAITPASTPGTPNLGPLPGAPVEACKVPERLMKELPEVACSVRARIPTLVS
jgi:hypothetical protein